MITYHVGNLFDAEKKNCIIAHVCNNMGGWGSGFVVPLGRNYPKAREEYYNNTSYILGHTQLVEISQISKVYVANMIAQTLGGKRPLYYNHLARCMDQVRDYAKAFEVKIYAPLFGSKLAGGNWDFIEQLIIDSWNSCHLDVHIFQLAGEELREDGFQIKD